MRHVATYVIAVVAAVSLVGGLFLVLDDRSGPPIVIEDPLLDATVVVAVEGAVVRPGVYALPADARLQDALTAAGGPAAGADRAAINPARRIRDEERIVVPSTAAIAGSPPPVSLAGSNAAGATSSGGPLDLNAASATDLDQLPGIGPVLAQRIVDYRTANGSFRSVEDLAKVDGISARMVEDLRPLLVVRP